MLENTREIARKIAATIKNITMVYLLRKEDAMTLGERLLILRRRRGLSQGGVGKASGLNRNTIARLEQDDLHDLGGQSIVKLARALDCTTDVLLGMVELDTADAVQPSAPAPPKRPRPRKAAPVA